MAVSGRITRFFIINSFITLIACSERIEDRKSRHLLTLIEYIRGLNNVQSNAQKLHPYYILPSVLVLPSVNQHQNINIQESSGQEVYQENGKTIQIKGFAKLISNESSIEIEETKKANITFFKKVNETINESKLNEKNFVTLSYTYDDYGAEKQTTVVVKDAPTETTTQANGPYLPALYNNESINYVELQNEASVNKNNTFRDERNETMVLENNNNNLYNKELYPALDIANNKTMSVTKAPLTTAINNSTLSLDYILPPVQDNRWRKFLTTKNYYPSTLNGFKPLAGLYYDGFLHRPLTKKKGFEPIKNIVK